MVSNFHVARYQKVETRQIRVEIPEWGRWVSEMAQKYLDIFYGRPFIKKLKCKQIQVKKMISCNSSQVIIAAHNCHILLAIPNPSEIGIPFSLSTHRHRPPGQHFRKINKIEILAEIKIHILTRAELLCPLCYEIPCS